MGKGGHSKESSIRGNEDKGRKHRWRSWSGGARYVLRCVLRCVQVCRYWLIRDRYGEVQQRVCLTFNMCEGQGRVLCVVVRNYGSQGEVQS